MSDNTTPFAAGAFTFRRFAVIGDAAKMPGQEHLDRLTEFKLESSESSVPDETEYGWSGGRHMFDNQFSFEHNVYNDCICCGLRIDTNKAPSTVKRSYEAIEMQAMAAANPSGFISKAQRRDAKDIVRRKLDDELKLGKHRKTKVVPVLWDMVAGELYAPASATIFDYLSELFERTFNLQLRPLSAGVMASRFAEPRGLFRNYEDSRPTRFVIGQEGDGHWPEYPWVAKGSEPKDFLGNEFGLWLWNATSLDDGAIKTASGEVTVFLDRHLDLDCAYSQTGKDGLRGWTPHYTPEARYALRTGKLPRKAGILLHAAGADYQFKINFETFELSTTKLPDIEEADTPRVLFEERITYLRDLNRHISRLFETFLAIRLSSEWNTEVARLHDWIMRTGKAAA